MNTPVPKWFHQSLRDVEVHTTDGTIQVDSDGYVVEDGINHDYLIGVVGFVQVTDVPLALSCKPEVQDRYLTIAKEVYSEAQGLDLKKLNAALKVAGLPPVNGLRRSELLEQVNASG